MSLDPVDPALYLGTRHLLLCLTHLGFAARHYTSEILLCLPTTILYAIVCISLNTTHPINLGPSSYCHTLLVEQNCSCFSSLAFKVGHSLYRKRVGTLSCIWIAITFSVLLAITTCCSAVQKASEHL